MTKKFTTKFGHHIPIIENYRIIHGKTDYRTFEELLFNKEETFYQQRASFLSNLVEYSIVFEYLESLGIKKKFEAAFVLMVFKKKESIEEKISYLKDNRDKRFIK